MYISWLYTLGSAIFLAASILFHPHFTAESSLYLAAVCGFVAGSVTFTWAGALEVWQLMGIPGGATGVWGAAILSLVGSLLWLAGSLAFWPELGPDGPVVGAYTFRSGSVAYIVSSGWSLREVWAAAPPPRRLGRAAWGQLVTLLAYTAGAAGFIAGGMAYLEDSPVAGSALWTIGSLMFLVGSAVPLLRSRALADPRPDTDAILG